MKWPVVAVISATMLSAAIAWSSRTTEAGTFGPGSYMIVKMSPYVWQLNVDTGELRVCANVSSEKAIEIACSVEYPAK